jgi:hypothetical protein
LVIQNSYDSSTKRLSERQKSPFFPTYRLFLAMQDCILDGEPLCIRPFLLDRDTFQTPAPHPSSTRDMRSISHTIAFLDDAAPVEAGSVDDPYKLFESMGAWRLVDGNREWCAFLCARATRV